MDQSKEIKRLSKENEALKSQLATLKDENAKKIVRLMDVLDQVTKTFKDYVKWMVIENPSDIQSDDDDEIYDEEMPTQEEIDSVTSNEPNEKEEPSEPTENEMKIIRVIGEGYSLSSEIQTMVGEKGITILRGLQALEKKGLIVSVYGIHALGANYATLHKLTPSGVKTYKKITGEEPYEAQMDIYRNFYN